MNGYRDNEYVSSSPTPPHVMGRSEGERIESPPEVPPVPAGRRSLRLQIRYLRTLLFAMRIFFRVLLWHYVLPRLFGQEWVEPGNLARWVKTAREFRFYAIKMGGVMIKLGQFISSRVDVLPPEITHELAGLQDEVPPVPRDEMMTVLEAELGDPSSRFDKIDQTAVAAASIGQVYRARLKNGDRVVIKIQRPGIREVIYTDLSALRIVAHIANRFRFIRRRADVVALAQEFGRVLLEETSYRREAYNARRFTRMFKDDMGIYIPAVYDEHTTDTVLVMEDVTSIKITDYAAMEAAGINRNAVAKRLMDCYMKQVFEERYFHADPHPGNLFVYPLPSENGSTRYGKSGRPFYLIFVDFGMTGSLSPEIAAGMINTLTAIVSRDSAKMVRSFMELGFLLPDANVERIEEAARAAFDQVWGLSMTDIKNVSYDEARNLAHEFNDLIFSMPFQVPQDYIYLGRCLGILSGMATSLDPSFNPWQELQPYAQKMIARTLKSDTTGDAISIPILQGLLNGNPGQVLAEVGKSVVNRAVVFPQQVDNLLHQIERGELTVQVTPTAAYRRQMRRLETQGKRTVRAVVFGSLLISSTLLYTNGDVVPAIIGYAFSGLTFLSLWFGGE